MSALTYKKNDDIESGNLDKMTVFQDCISGFNTSPIQSKKCRILLAKLIHLLSTGDSFPPEEATTLFFSITKLFQHRDVALRQMVYLAIKELSATANDVIMVTSSIMKDVQAANDMIYKPNAIRALVRIIDASIVQGIERLMKTAIVDRHAAISSAALISSYHLLPIAKDIVRRWANETQEAVITQKSFPSSVHGSSLDSSSGSNYSPGISTMTQYHALGLLYHLRAHDRMALMKMIQQFSGTGSALRNANAIVMLIRYIAKIIDEDQSNTLRPQLYGYLEGWLRHKSDIVNLEAAKTILALPNVSEVEAHAAISVLQAFLGSPRTVSRFAAIRILNRFAMIKPQSVVACNIEIESLINDPSRSIATYAITTLLKTGTEASVDRLMSQISGFMNDISDEFKVIVVDAIRSLALKFPAKHGSMLTFLAGTLRDEGGITFKTAVVEALFDMIRFIPDSRDTALGHLCEFIEDCEFTELTVRILHLLGVEGPKTGNPTIYVRYIYNRVVLENSLIRAAAITALAQFALVDNAQIKDSIKVLLTRSLDDPTDEVRDRATLSLRLLGLQDQSVAKEFLRPTAKYSLPQLEHVLATYVSGGKEQFATPLDISSVPRLTEEQVRAQTLKNLKAQEEEQVKSKSSREGAAANAGSNAKGASGANGAGKNESADLQKSIDNAKYAQELQAIPEFQSYGPIFKSSSKIPLTESETEYVVTAVKHMFKEHLVIQYDVTNTFNEYVLENVIAEVQGELEEEFIIPIDRLVPDSTGTIYVSFARDSADLVTGTCYNNLKFVSKEIDPDTNEPQDGGFDDDYSLENLEILAGDYVTPSYIGNFQHQWDELASFESTGAYQLPGSSSIADATATLVSHLNMMALDGSDSPTSESTHTLKLFGKCITGEKVIALIQMVYRSANGVTLKIAARSENESIPELLTDSIGVL
ncbi:Sec21p [Sugiyamaella lignohabitans]|uniref:Coatomer subunit gamma n=1 Tax=Sugiyamaella lignohabitans TaxID=796027 RepID=A0A167CGX1_9ASCO|nr:Sec21p [Sugiyamaella lignohabitans]ANB11679.1 Sec21p [Sugiyamaella lignohabitans]